jgi:hypothetical protein
MPHKITLRGYGLARLATSGLIVGPFFFAFALVLRCLAVL